MARKIPRPPETSSNTTEADCRSQCFLMGRETLSPINFIMTVPSGKRTKKTTPAITPCAMITYNQLKSLALNIGKYSLSHSEPTCRVRRICKIRIHSRRKEGTAHSGRCHIHFEDSVIFMFRKNAGDI